MICKLIYIALKHGHEIGHSEGYQAKCLHEQKHNKFPVKIGISTFYIWYE